MKSYTKKQLLDHATNLAKVRKRILAEQKRGNQNTPRLCRIEQNEIRWFEDRGLSTRGTKINGLVSKISSELLLSKKDSTGAKKPRNLPEKDDEGVTTRRVHGSFVPAKSLTF